MTSVALWDDLLAGEELAYLTTEPPRAARTAPLPDALHPKLARRSHDRESSSSTRTRRSRTPPSAPAAT